MGETGCGKTRLIRYMCDLQSFGSGGYKTMLMMKVFLYYMCLATYNNYWLLGTWRHHRERY